MSGVTYVISTVLLIGALGCQSTAPCEAFFREAQFSAPLLPIPGNGADGIVTVGTSEYRHGSDLTQSSLVVANLQWHVTYSGLDPFTAVIHIHEAPGGPTAPVLYSAIGFQSGPAGSTTYVVYQSAVPFDTLFARLLDGKVIFDIHAPGSAVPTASGALTAVGSPLAGTACIG